ncbi:acyltransferase [Azohydromonas lata]|uniref:Acyltransferase n=1 Tax=Azohydromonas lata TaxID=45677 RepID=A0ABU5IBR4_9BURK|nr:acyltransferase [Azohydromonas lata]MDZ5456529.1 acyltransferase [Azohydromonas lata]
MIKTLVRAFLPIRLRVIISLRSRRGRLSIGRGSRIHRTTQIFGRAHVRIGNNTSLAERTWLNVNHPSGDTPAIIIGNNCFIGRDNFFTSGKSIVIGDYCLTGIGCRFVGSTHVADDPRRPIISTGTTATDIISVGSNCFFGTDATVLGHVNIGHGCVIGARSVVTKDVPPFSVVVGSPARVIKRFSFRRNAWISVDQLAEGDLDDNPDAQKYSTLLRSQYPEVMLPWVAAGTEMGSF